MGALAASERQLHADFLAHLDALDRRRGYAELGYPSLWEFCLRALHLREGSAGRRIAAMRVLRRFPQLEPALRDGRLGMSSLAQLAPVLNEENVADIAARAAFKSTREVEEIVASTRPRAAPHDGVRLARRAQPAVVDALQLVSGDAVTPASSWSPRGTAAPSSPASESQPARPAVPTTDDIGGQSPPVEVAARLTVVASGTWSLRVTLDTEAQAHLEMLTRLLSHRIAPRDVAAIVKEALRCAVEKHGKRRGAVLPSQSGTGSANRTRGSGTRGSGTRGNGTRGNGARAKDDRAKSDRANSPAATRYIPASVRREVWARDGGTCTFTARDGTRCGSRERIELDHIQPFALGGAATSDNLRLRCRTHNALHAEEHFGRAHMARFRAQRNRAAVEAAHGPAP